MAKFMDPQVKRRLKYNRANLQLAYQAVIENGKSVYRAARDYQVPEMTLRDRVKGKVAVDARVGKETLFTREEEKKLVEHLVYMSKIGYGYTKTDIQYLGKDFAVGLGKKLKSEESTQLQLSNNWFYSFLGRWEELKLVKPQKLSIARAKNASPQHINNYFKELSTLLTNNNLHNKPEKIFNIDETGVTTSHSPPKVVCDKSTKPQSITSERSSTVTIIAGGNAMGNFIPPYYVFPGKRWNPEFLVGAAPGANGVMSDSGWSNMQVFDKYIKTHFAKNAGITDLNQEPVLILYDGHRSHISLTLSDWARKRNVILFVLPPHSSHLTQPLDVGVFGPFKNMYSRECSTFMQKNPGICISKYDIATLTCHPYLKALSPQNLIASFKKTGIYPFNNKAILPDETAPSSIYTCIIDDSTSNVTNTENSHADDIPQETIQNTNNNETQEPNTENEIQELHTENETQEPTTENETQEPNTENETQEPTIIHSTSVASTFFETRTIKQALVKKPKRKFVPPYLAGNLAKKSNMNIIQSQAATKKAKLMKDIPSNKSAAPAKKTKVTKKIKPKEKHVIDDSMPGTSGLGKGGGPLVLSEDSTDMDMDSDAIFTDDEELCCVCNLWKPKELASASYFVIVHWGQCENCDHWTHLKYCSPVVSLRRDSRFRCPHCTL